MRPTWVASWNVQGGGSPTYQDTSAFPPRMPLIQAGVKSLDADVIGLIDTFRWRELFTLDQLRELFGYSQVFDFDLGDLHEDGRIGITVLGRGQIIKCEPVTIHDRICVRAAVQMGHRVRSVYFVYLTVFSGERRRQQVKALLRYIKTADPQGGVMVMGDLNCLRPEAVGVAAGILRRSWRTPRWVDRLHRPLAQGLELLHTDAVDMLRTAGMRDNLQETRRPTFRGTFMGRPVRLALDYCFSTFEVPHCRVITNEVIRAASDHEAIMATLQ